MSAMVMNVPLGCSIICSTKSFATAWDKGLNMVIYEKELFDFT